jgi:sulfate transport system substrate-binding protein
MKRIARSLAASFAVVGAVVLTACGGGSSDSSSGSAGGGGVTLSLFAYSVPKPGFDKEIAAFNQTPAGKGVSINGSYGPSGDQSRKVAAGAPADIVDFSVEPDITRLVKAGLVDPTWNQDADKGIPFGSVVVIVVRKGNPKNIHDWNDLLQPGISVVTPNPLSSGSAKWNLLAPYAAASDGGQNQQAGLDYVNQLVSQHVHAQPASGRDATQAFLSGTGDALISYENEALQTEAQGAPIEHVIPPVTVKIENPFAVLKNTKNLPQAAAFRDFLYTKPGQEAWAQAGFRPVDPAVLAEYTAKFPQPAQRLYTIADLGGWKKVDAQLFDPKAGLITAIYTNGTK